ncbi:MAG TPA: hypothetical protein [Caudoviricetes sp.]|nr:MAG TPA: hypothetical protein [Caudoviricetes sp.]
MGSHGNTPLRTYAPDCSGQTDLTPIPFATRSRVLSLTGVLELGMNPTVFFLRFGHSPRVVVGSVTPQQ